MLKNFFFTCLSNKHSYSSYIGGLFFLQLELSYTLSCQDKHCQNCACQNNLILMGQCHEKRVLTQAFLRQTRPQLRTTYGFDKFFAFFPLGESNLESVKPRCQKLNIKSEIPLPGTKNEGQKVRFSHLFNGEIKLD